MEHFIESVKRFPCLWNTNAIEYRDQELKEASWTEVMKETNLGSVKEVKNKWKKLRDSYRDALKRQSDMIARDPVNAAKRPYPWKYMGLMQFLLPHMSARSKKLMPFESQIYPPMQIENGQMTQNGTESHSTDESESEIESSPPRKRQNSEQLTVIDRKLDYLCKSQTKKMAQYPEPSYQDKISPQTTPGSPLPDPLDIFFNSMCQSTKRLPFQNQIKIKKILFNAVIEAEEQIAAAQQTYANMWTNNAASSSSSNQDEEESEQKDQSFMQAT